MEHLRMIIHWIDGALIHIKVQDASHHRIFVFILLEILQSLLFNLYYSLLPAAEQGGTILFEKSYLLLWFCLDWVGCIYPYHGAYSSLIVYDAVSITVHDLRKRSG